MFYFSRVFFLVSLCLCGSKVVLFIWQSFARLSAASWYSKASSKPGEAYPVSHHKRLRQEDACSTE